MRVWLPAPDHHSARFGELATRFRGILLAGFGLVLVAMTASGVLCLRALRQIGEDSGVLSAHFLQETSLIDELVRDQTSTGMLLYAMLQEKHPARLRSLLAQSQDQAAQVDKLIAGALATSPPAAEAAAWREVSASARPLYEEISRLLAGGQQKSAELSLLHRRFVAATARLLEVSYDDAQSARRARMQSHASQLTDGRMLFLAALGLAVLAASASILGSLALFRRLERHAETLGQLSIHTLAEQEEAARRFSQEMHDEFGQALNACESTLAVVKPRDEESAARLADALSLLKEVQAMAREMSQLLRPRILDDFGLDAGLRELASGFSRRTGIAVDYHSNLRGRMDPVAETHLFRITQEALANISRHTLATEARISLELQGGVLTLSVGDNGGGFQAKAIDAPGGLGLLGMSERASAIGASLSINSRPEEGVRILVRLPLPALVPQPPGQLEERMTFSE